MVEFLGANLSYVIKAVGLVLMIPWQVPPVYPGSGPHRLKNRNNGDIVPPGGVVVKHYTTPPSRQ